MKMRHGTGFYWAWVLASYVIAILLLSSTVRAQPNLQPERYINQQQCETSGESEDVLLRAVCNARTVNNTIMAAVVTQHYSRSMLPIFLGSLRLAHKSDRHFLMFTSDHLAYDHCVLFHKYRENCIYLQHKDLYALVWWKHELALTLLKMGVSALMVDIDMVFFSDPTAYMENLPQRDLYAQNEGYTPGDTVSNGNWVNSGFYFVRPTKKGIAFVEKWLAEDHSQWDQGVLSRLVGDTSPPGVVNEIVYWDVLPPESNVNHCAWGVRSEKLDEIEKHLSAYYTNSDAWKTFVFVHFNCLAREEGSTKVAYMATALKVMLDRHVAEEHIDRSRI